MIRLRHAVIRLTRRRWVGPLVIAVLVLLIAFVALHEGFAIELGGTCATIVLILVATASAPRLTQDAQPGALLSSRAPPRRFRPPALVCAAPASPLRL